MDTGGGGGGSVYAQVSAEGEVGVELFLPNDEAGS